MCSMSWMIVELVIVRPISIPGQGNIIQVTYVRTLLPHPALISKDC